MLTRFGVQSGLVSELNWAYLLEEVGASTTRLIVRRRGDYSPGLGIPLASALGVEGGALTFQPKTLRGIKSRAEAAGRQQRREQSLNLGRDHKQWKLISDSLSSDIVLGPES